MGKKGGAGAPRLPVPWWSGARPGERVACSPGPVCFISFNTVGEVKAGQGAEGEGDRKGRGPMFSLPTLSV